MARLASISSTRSRIAAIDFTSHASASAPRKPNRLIALSKFCLTLTNPTAAIFWRRIDNRHSDPGHHIARRKRRSPLLDLRSLHAHSPAITQKKQKDNKTVSVRPSCLALGSWVHLKCCRTLSRHDGPTVARSRADEAETAVEEEMATELTFSP
jgi:hypothetical protein